MLRDNEEHNATMKEVISHLVKLLPNLTSPKARASILWVIGEYNHKVPKMAPDVLRQLAKSFPDEVIRDEKKKKEKKKHKKNIN